MESRSGVTFTEHEYEDDFALIGHADHKIALEMPEMLHDIRALRDAPSALTTPEFPVVLSAGERRAYTANDIFRDPAGASAMPKGPCVSALRTLRRWVWSPVDAHASPPWRAAPKRASRSARRCCPAMRRCPTGSASTSSTRRGRRCSRCRAERTDVNAVAGRVRGHAVAQARACPYRSRKDRRRSVIGRSLRLLIPARFWSRRPCTPSVYAVSACCAKSIPEISSSGSIRNPNVESMTFPITKDTTNAKIATTGMASVCLPSRDSPPP